MGAEKPLCPRTIAEAMVQRGRPPLTEEHGVPEGAPIPHHCPACGYPHLAKRKGKLTHQPEHRFYAGPGSAMTLGCQCIRPQKKNSNRTTSTQSPLLYHTQPNPVTHECLCRGTADPNACTSMLAPSSKAEIWHVSTNHSNCRSQKPTSTRRSMTR